MRPAEPLIEVVIEEKTSFCEKGGGGGVGVSLGGRLDEMGKGGKEKGRGIYGVIQDILVAGVVVDVYRDAAEGGDFGGEFGEEVVVLSDWGKRQLVS